MTATLRCPHCGQQWDLTPGQQAQYAGQTITCTACQRPFQVDAAAAAGAGAAPVPPPMHMPMPGQPQAVGYAAIPAGRTSGLAIASLVCACLGLVLPLVGIVGLVLGIVALTRMKDPAVRGKGLAIAGISVGALSTVMSMCMISILLPSLNRARETANRVYCASNLRQIGQAMLIYANENRGVYPPTPDLLVLTQDIEPVTFTCPSTSHEPAALPDGTPRPAVAASIMQPGQNSYVYVGAGKTNSAGAETILAYEPIANHDGDGGNFLFGDGHVEFLPKDTANSVIAELNAGYNPPRPKSQRADE